MHLFYNGFLNEIVRQKMLLFPSYFYRYHKFLLVSCSAQIAKFYSLYSLYKMYLVQQTKIELQVIYSSDW